MKEIKLKTLKNTSFDELLDVISGCDNVKSVVFDNDEKLWTIHYKNDFNHDVVESEQLIDFLENA